MSKLAGVQLYSLRQELALDFVATVRELAEIGFPVAEGYAKMPLTHDSVAQILKAHDIRMLSCHLPLPTEENRREIMQAVELYDLRYVVVPSLPREDFVTLEGVQRVCERLNQANALFQNSDVVFGYHNHDFEFKHFDGRTAYDVMIEELDPNIILELDTYWAQLAGQDPSELVRRLGNRSPLLHIKDGEANSAKRDQPMVALGTGQIDIPSIVAASGDNAECLIIELDSCATDMMEALRISYQFLQDNDLTGGIK